MRARSITVHAALGVINKILLLCSLALGCVGDHVAVHYNSGRTHVVPIRNISNFAQLCTTIVLVVVSQLVSPVMCHSGQLEHGKATGPA
ncbi:hypothetical protein K470DRAFT_255093 [Piedraia hortae CBS 480.64]|uniref:Uncharacterized protein n=1 Tax=Piedraia hortae CBS 480.64 TaxID=1314780 RepID=A0A6A7C825_9PEZI|nr:hypothetical protein K470DRAFT_255093 [Piedraia hortae CBS 480.64]